MIGRQAHQRQLVTRALGDDLERVAPRRREPAISRQLHREGKLSRTREPLLNGLRAIARELPTQAHSRAARHALDLAAALEQPGQRFDARRARTREAQVPETRWLVERAEHRRPAYAPNAADARADVEAPHRVLPRRAHLERGKRNRELGAPAALARARLELPLAIPRGILAARVQARADGVARELEVFLVAVARVEEDLHRVVFPHGAIVLPGLGDRRPASRERHVDRQVEVRRVARHAHRGLNGREFLRVYAPKPGERHRAGPLAGVDDSIESGCHSGGAGGDPRRRRIAQGKRDRRRNGEQKSECGHETNTHRVPPSPARVQPPGCYILRSRGAPLLARRGVGWRLWQAREKRVRQPLRSQSLIARAMRPRAKGADAPSGATQHASAAKEERSGINLAKRVSRLFGVQTPCADTLLERAGLRHGHWEPRGQESLWMGTIRYEVLVSRVGFEPTTLSLKGRCSAG